MLNSGIKNIRITSVLLNAIREGGREELLYPLVIVLIIVCALVWLFLGQASRHLNSRLITLQHKERQVNILARQVIKRDARRGHRANNQSRQTIDSLLGWLERQVGSSGLTGHLAQISPVAVEDGESYREKAALSLKNISMARLLPFIDRLEKAAQIRIIRTDIKRQNDSTGGVYFNCVIALEGN